MCFLGLSFSDVQITTSLPTGAPTDVTSAAQVAIGIGWI
jgi:hypothetical protein